MWTRARRRLRRTITQRILRLNDTPHRIAFGVFLGFVVGWTPTMGAQIILYWILATLLRANKASGILPVLLTNPVTALPVYLFNWKIGQWILHGGGVLDAGTAQLQQERISRFMAEFSLTRLTDGGFWQAAGEAFRGLGMELIVGCLVVGLLCGTAGYLGTYYSVKAYRRRRAAGARSASSPAPSPDSAV